MLAAWPVIRLPSRRATLAILGCAMIFRLAALGIAPSDDLRRYVVEGALVAHGGNPYVTAPADPATCTAIADTVSPALQRGVNHPEWTAIYPPLALLVEAAIAQVSPTLLAQKLGALLAELATLLVMLSVLRRRGLPDTAILLLAWNPVAILWTAGEGHNDAFAMLGLAVAIRCWDRGAEVRGTLAVTAATLCKPFALAALGARFVQRPGWHALPALGLAALVTLPFVDAGAGLLRSFGRFGTELHHSGVLEPWIRAGWDAAGLPFHLLQTATVATLAGILALGALWLWQRRDPGDDPLLLPGRATVLLLACLPTLHPWYLTILLPFLPIFERRAPLEGRLLLGWTAIAPLHWLHGLAMDGGERWGESDWVTAVTHTPLFAMLCVTALRPGRNSRARAALEVG